MYACLNRPFVDVPADVCNNLFPLRMFCLLVCNCNNVSIYRGTHGYMAPEVLSKGTAYDSSADWFSFGCMMYKLLKGYVFW